MLAFIKKIFGAGSVDYKALIKKGAIIVDVRTGPEFDQGHIGGAINIPADRVAGRIAEFRRNGKPVICCCQSGTRSSTAVKLLKKAGVEAYNGGNWQSLYRKIAG